jgi:putative DNA-invertase from lambdoid prophage Rac
VIEFRSGTVAIGRSIKLTIACLCPKNNYLWSMAKAKKRTPKAASKPLVIETRRKGVFGAAVYCRVSTTSQTHDSQLKPLREYCERRGWDILVEVCDVASGASVRPARDALIAAARRREIDAIVCFKLDRWGRSTTDLVTSLSELDSCGCAFVSITDALDMTTPSGRALAGMLAVFAGFERDLIRERVHAGLEAAKAKGVQLGRPRTSTNRADEVKALRSLGLSQRQIAAKLGLGNGSVARLLSAES